MNQYRRIVSYLYKYDKGKKGDNTGFVRIDTREEGIRLHFRIKDMRMMEERKLKMYFYFHKEKSLQLVFVDEFLCVRGNCEYKKMVFPDFTDRDFEKINGVVFLDGQGLLYGSCWDEREISEELLKEGGESEEKILIEQEEAEEELLPEQENTDKELLPEQENTDKELLLEQENTEEELFPEQEETGVKRFLEPVMEVEKEKSGNIFSDFPYLDLHYPDGMIQAVRIQIENIPMLSVKEWKLADNAFLKQAYKEDSHLLLGKISMPNNGEVWILGVPGVYDNREKYLAGMFGFPNYIPLENREYKTGGKGYWIRQIEKVE